MFDEAFFKNKPALAALKDKNYPSCDLLRACVLELSLHIMKQDELIKDLQEELRLRR